MLAFSAYMCYHTLAHPRMRHAPIAQLDRVTDYESVGRGFESLSAYQKIQIPLWGVWNFLYTEGLERTARPKGVYKTVQWTVL